MPDNHFDYITCIGVIVHLTQRQVVELFIFSYNKLKPGGKFFITTPNYASAWPLLEVFLNLFSDVKYEEQHITKFNYFNVFRKLELIVPGFYGKFRPVFKTTTHLATPFVAGINFKLAEKIASSVSPSKWKIPLGVLLLLELGKL